MLISVWVKRLHSEHNLRTIADVKVRHLKLLSGTASTVRVSSGLKWSREDLPLLSQSSLPAQWPLQLKVTCPTDHLYWPKAASGRDADDLSPLPRRCQLFIKGGKNSTDLSKEPMWIMSTKRWDPDASERRLNGENVAKRSCLHLVRTSMIYLLWKACSGLCVLNYQWKKVG